MGKMWKILEDYSPDEMGYRGEMDGYDEGFEEGCEHGYRKAMKEMRMMSHRDNMGNMQDGTTRMNRRFMPPYPPYMNYRDDDDDDYEEMNMRRRRRDSRGRYM